MDERRRAVDEEKEQARGRMWALLEGARISPLSGPRGGIPDFVGCVEAADRLATLPEWDRAEVIKINPDTAQLPVRARALAAGKLVYMAVPKLARDHPFVLLDPARLSPDDAADKNWAVREGVPTHVRDMLRVDLVVAGSLAVNRAGARLGKGAGYTDIELGLLMDAGRIAPDTPVATTVHQLQVVDEPLPQRGFDFEVSVIVTPGEVIRISDPRPSPGIVWDDLDEAKIAAIPVLAAR
jgi:5-formyltetrahydrofolate cyclo-ligase